MSNNPALDGKLAARRDNAEALRSDSEVAEEIRGVFQLLSTRALLHLVLSGVHAAKAARVELASRGLGRDGRWVGFDAAAKTWRV